MVSFRNPPGSPDPTWQRSRPGPLLEVCRNLSRFQDLDSFLQTIIEAIRSLLQSDASYILLHEPETRLLKFIATPSNQLERLKRARISLENSVCGMCFTKSQRLVIQNEPSDSSVYREVDGLLGFNTHSILAVPLFFRDETIGVVEAVNKKGGANYTEEDATILEIFASQIAIAIKQNDQLAQLQQFAEEAIEFKKRQENFTAIASHEFRTPLSHILGYASDLSENLRDPQLRQQAQIIVNKAAKLQEIIDNLVNSDQSQTVKAQVEKKRFPLDKLIHEISEAYNDLAHQKHITLITDLPEISLQVEGDEEKIAIALNNLIKNALEFTEEYGHVMISVESLPGYVKVSVVDDGIGVPQKDLSQVFERFYQVEEHMTRRHGGMGLGLSVAKAMIEMHGGEIWAESIQGCGSNFSFLIPTTQGQAKAASVFEPES